MSAGTRRPTAERRDEIARAALQIVGQRGLAALTAASLAQEIGVTSGALFRHFASREEILDASVRHAIARIEETFPASSLPQLERVLALAEMPADPSLPDCCFVEDVAVVLDEVAILTMPGAPSRRGEVPAIEQALRRWRPVERVELPATLEGGDVLRLGRTLFVGLSRRTNPAGVARLRGLAEPLGYVVVPVPVTGCLHLKGAVTALGDDRVLMNPRWLDASPFDGLERVLVAPEETGAANVLQVRGTVVAHQGFPRTLERVARSGSRVRTVDISEFLKAEAALTCKSLLLRR